MRVLVTGGAGFIGSAVCRYLIGETDAVVLNVDALTYAATLDALEPVSSSPRYKFAKQDIRNSDALRSLFAAHQPDLVLHLAAETHVDRSITDPMAFVGTNVVGTCSLLETAREYWQGLPAGRQERFRFLNVSTDEVYGSLGETGLFSEHSVYDPSSPYSASKAAADHLVLAWHRTYGLPVIISNCSNNYGPYQFPEKLIPRTLLNALEGLPVEVYGDGSNVRDWLHVEDHARALVLIARSGRIGERYNVGGSSERTNLDIVETICGHLDEQRPAAEPRRSLIRFVADRPGHDQRYAIDSTKIRTELGWVPEKTLESGLAATIDWYLAHDAWWRPVRDKIYGGERLGLIKQGRA